MRSLRTPALFTALAIAAATPAYLNCGATGAEEELTEDNIGVNNTLGLGLRYDEKSGSIQATLKRPLDEGETLVVRLRAGKIQENTARDLKCSDLIEAEPIPGREASGKVAFQGPKVDRAVFDLVRLFDDPNWATGRVSAAQLETAKNPDPIVEACLMKGLKVRAKLVTNLAYAYDQGTKDANLRTQGSGGLGTLAGDGGLAASDSGPGASGRRDGGPVVEDAGAPEPPRVVNEDNLNSQIEYGSICEKELGDIPFFPKIADGKYETFDCRDLVANGRDGTAKHKVDGVEGSKIPAFVNGVEATVCSPGMELGENSSSYGCLEKADHGMYLDNGGTQPGPMVVTAKNTKGTHWILLCRKVADDGKGMMKSKKFNDMAMLGHNPRTGRTCFFQNSIGSGTDGSKVPHPADVDKSTTVWSSSVQSYCSGSCHGNSPFVHSAWIDGAKRANGKAVVPMLGQHADLPISTPLPYNLVAADKLGFKLPKILISEEASACTNCHTLAQGKTMGDFTEWSTGTGDTYMNKMTDSGKKFRESHWMPMNLEGLDETNFKASKYGKALEFIKKCNNNTSDPACEWADLDRGSHNNPKVQ
jgi:hypothetical protein